MKKALLINGAKVFTSSLGVGGGKLNATLQSVAKEHLESNGYQVIETIIDDGYNKHEEVEKWLSSDLVIWQFPAWWMGEPYIVKEYIDKVFITGVGRFYKNDGRSRENPKANYGTGGLLKGKKVMFSMTWNAPLEAFSGVSNQKDSAFFEGHDIEVLILHLRKAHEYIGMSALKTFMCNDVVKDPQVSRYIEDYKKHLEAVL